ncbi:flagellar assembly protein FliH [Jeongeupia naejangsanensis]|uniref:Flagellar assembly protein FliH n=1 Tax=Jeongeupia naejangsanensis TaxID=613195 RepID=A0ABS2BGI4_9NEIS|nr:flagellar assembly protein FliH [Jeongeupia naejangsanensis]MBM3114719.1 flagellar assembly protein H [Jeongeupia naejangsanensis]
MKACRPYRFPPLSQKPGALALPGDAAQVQASLAEGFQQGMDTGYREGFDSGLDNGRAEGFVQGRADGLVQGVTEAKLEMQARFDVLMQPLDTALTEVRALQADYQAALRKEVVDLVAKVARQVIRCELALQPVQLLALVDETLASMPPAPNGVEVYLNPEECQRIRELAPERAQQWSLIPDARLEPGECRVKAGGQEADAGCRQRLDAFMEQVTSQLLGVPDTSE